METAERNDIYDRLSVALEQRRGDSLEAAARRMVIRRGPQIMAAHKVLLGEGETGQRVWDRLKAAVVLAERCKWPNALRPRGYVGLRSERGICRRDG